VSLYDFCTKCRGVKDARGVSTSCIVIALSACWLTNLALARISPGTWAGGMIITGAVMVCTLGNRRFSVVGLVSGGLNIGVTHQIAGMAPGVLLRVCGQWVHAVVIKFCLAIGSRICMIAGASDILGIGMWASVVLGGSTVSLFTLSSSLGGDVSMSSSAFCSPVISCRPLCVSAAMPVNVVISLVSAFKCALLLRFGTWQCCGNNSAEPEILYARVYRT
jgi:hypothetical protein